ncbi:unnamed protein product [Cercopithifilaria johnstoni]|uniref:Apple domain-containing protein n=1 Tax=Cercopithifilaria johnstoni TaxID=2874296 RepID=A0A8J2Q106_9BILA|nr:unnamed protein product [Cercopithifilaria johnstoni]
MLMLLYLAYVTTNVETVQQICHMESTNRSFTGILYISLRTDIKHCKRECLTFSTSQCSAVMYVISKNLCLLISGQQIEENEFIGQDTMNFHRICRRSTKAQSILLKKACFEEFHGRVLLGVVDEIYENVSKIQCRKACAVSLFQSNVSCKAAIYYPKEHECIISSQNRLDLPELFIEDAVAIYLENRCADERFLNRTHNENDTEKTTFLSTTANSLFFKNEKLLPSGTSNTTLNRMPKKLVKDNAKHERQPLRNVERSGYEMNFNENLRPPYPLHAEHHNSRINPETVDNYRPLFRSQKMYLTY